MIRKHLPVLPPEPAKFGRRTLGMNVELRCFYECNGLCLGEHLPTVTHAFAPRGCTGSPITALGIRLSRLHDRRRRQARRQLTVCYPYLITTFAEISSFVYKEMRSRYKSIPTSVERI